MIVSISIFKIFDNTKKVVIAVYSSRIASSSAVIFGTSNAQIYFVPY